MADIRLCNKVFFTSRYVQSELERVQVRHSDVRFDCCNCSALICFRQDFNGAWWSATIRLRTKCRQIHRKWKLRNSQPSSNVVQSRWEWNSLWEVYFQLKIFLTSSASMAPCQVCQISSSPSRRCCRKDLNRFPTFESFFTWISCSEIE